MKTILIVDDDVGIRETFSEFFQKVAGFNALTASNGREGIDLISNEDVDILITDRKMPGGPPGEEVVRAMRIKYPRSKYPNRIIVFMTGNLTEVVKRTALAAGADIISEKPVNLKEILSLIDSP